MKAVSTLRWIRGTQRWNNGRWKIKLGLPRNIKRGRPGAAKPPLSLICWLNVNDTRHHSPAKTSCSASLRPLCAAFDFFSHLSEPLFFRASPPHRPAASSRFASVRLASKGLCTQVRLRSSQKMLTAENDAVKEKKKKYPNHWTVQHEFYLILFSSLCSRSPFCASLLSLALFSLTCTYFMFISFPLSFLSSCYLL